MLHTYRKLEVNNLSENCGLSNPQPDFEKVDLHSEAKKLMVDFTKVPAITANETISVNDALELMRVNRIRSLMIIDRNGEFSGVITAMDLMGKKPMVYAIEAGILRTDVIVKNIMLPKSKLSAISREDVEKSTVGDVMQTLSSLHEQHLLVVDGDDEEMKISGLFSASDFKRAIGVALETQNVAYTFSNLERVINGNKEVV